MTDPSSGRLCAGPGRPHLTDEGYLCRDHLQELATWLREIEEEAIRLTYDPDDPDAWPALPSMDTRWDAGGGTLASQRSPAVLDALVYLDIRTTAHGYRHIGPVCLRCASLTGHRCTCPPLSWRRTVHWAHCPRHGVHQSCMNILADRDEQADRGALQGEEKRGDPQTDRLLSVLAVLATWADRVRGERRMAGPTREIRERLPGRPRCACTRCDAAHYETRTVDAPATITGERDLLSRQLTWIATQPWVADMRSELGDLRNQLLRANKNQEDQPLPGWCPWLVDGQECGGHLWPEPDPAYSTGYATDAADPYAADRKPRPVVCERNPKHRWAGAIDLARLALIIEQQQKRADDDGPPAEPSPRLPAVPRPDDGLTPADRLALLPRDEYGLTIHQQKDTA